MKLTCLSKGGGFYFPPHHILNVSGFRILIDCPMDLSTLTIFSPLPIDFFPILDDESSDHLVRDALDTGLEVWKRQKIEKPLESRNLIYAEPWYKTATSLHLWDPSSIDIILISNVMGMLGLPFLTKSKGFSAKIYATEATVRLGKLMMEDLTSMHMEYRHFYGSEESGFPEWIKWEELELLPSALLEVVAGKDGKKLGEWMPLYSSMDVQDCIQKVQMLKYAEEACYNGTLVIKAFSSGLEIGSCNWTINGPKGNMAYVSSSMFVSAHAMEFDYRDLQGNDLILYSDFSSHYDMDDVELDDNSRTPTTDILSTLCSDENNWEELNKCLLSNDECLEEREKLAFISSCVVDSVKAGGSVLIPINRLGIALQLLEQIPDYLESSAVEVPIYVISSVAAELLAFTNIIPEWLCKQRQEKLFSGKPLFSHVELMKQKKLHVFPALHCPELLTNWHESCIVFAPHWSLRLGPVVHLLRRWCGDQNSLLVLEDGLDADMALLPFKPMAMKVLQCSFLSGIRLPKALPLLRILQPKIVLFPEHLRQLLRISNSSSNSFPFLFYNENEMLDVRDLNKHLNLEIATELITELRWGKSNRDDMDISRLEGQLFIDCGQYRLLSGNKVTESSESRPLLHWGSLPDLERLLAVLSNMGINGSIEKDLSDSESEIVGVINVRDPDRALIKVKATSTVISASNENLSARILEAVRTLLVGI